MKVFQQESVVPTGAYFVWLVVVGALAAGAYFLATLEIPSFWPLVVGGLLPFVVAGGVTKGLHLAFVRSPGFVKLATLVACVVVLAASHFGAWEFAMQSQKQALESPSLEDRKALAEAGIDIAELKFESFDDYFDLRRRTIFADQTTLEWRVAKRDDVEIRGSVLIAGWICELLLIFAAVWVLASDKEAKPFAKKAWRFYEQERIAEIPNARLLKFKAAAEHADARALAIPQEFLLDQAKEQGSTLWIWLAKASEQGDPALVRFYQRDPKTVVTSAHGSPVVSEYDEIKPLGPWCEVSAEELATLQARIDELEARPQG